MCDVISCHNHLDYSNLRLLDSTNQINEVLDTVAKLGYKGLAITDHETVSGHVKAIQAVRKMKEKGKLPEDFKLLLGNEIYLVDSLEDVRDNYKSGETKFPHFLLIAKDKVGHEQLRYLSSKAWENSFYTGTMERVPTVKEDLYNVVKNNPNHLIASSACLGSEVNIRLLAIRDANSEESANYHRKKLDEFMRWNIDLFGTDDFYIELQPALSDEQIYCNKQLIKLAEHYGLKIIVTTDSHFLRPEDREIHKAFLNAKDGEREVDDFYEACFFQSVDEMKERLSYLDEQLVNQALQNTLEIGEKVEDYTIEHSPIIPKINLPDFELTHLFEPVYDQYQYIKKMAHSDNEQDRYIIKLIEDGLLEKIPYKTMSKERFHEHLNRINLELGELWEISQNLNQSMPSYYITVREIINIIWDDDCGGNSLVGSGRGSAAGFLINYLLGITQIQPLDYDIELPHWRHIHKSRPDIPDIDIDTEGNKRPQILQALKNHFGEDRVLQVCTFGTEGSKSALQTACRGLGIDNDISLYLSGMIPFERGANWSLSDCFYGNEEKDRKPIKEFIREVEKYPNLKETALKIEGLINKRSVHAGGVILFNEAYYHTNAMMKAPNGTPVTQFNLTDSEAVGNVKFDLLTIEALDKIRATLDMLLENNEIEWQGSLRATFDKYLHPSNIELKDERLYEMLGSGEVLDLFQFSTEIGLQSAVKVKPRNLLETASANSLMRLMSDGEEQPIDTFIKFKNDISLWYKEMENYGLNEEEIKVLEKHLLKLNGVADTQESVMLLSMDDKIAGFDVKWANKLRKAIAKKDKSALEEAQTKFFEQGRSLGNSESILNYVWNVQIKRQLGYSFSILHTLAYSVIALQELNLNMQFNPLYWQTACLTVNAAGQETVAEEDSKNKSTDYGKIAQAIGNMQSWGIKIDLPNINKAEFGFKPDLENNSIIFGLKGINGIGDDVVQAIIKYRPYNNLNDFLVRMFDTKLLKKSQVIQLIKAGCFDTFLDRKEAMKEFAKHIFEPKTKLTMQNFKGLITNDLIPEKYYIHERIFKYKEYISQFVVKTLKNPKDKLIKLDDIATPFFYEHFTEDCVVDTEDGYLIISENKFKKQYDKKMEEVKEWLSQEATLNEINQKLFEIEYLELAQGSISKWEMDSLSYYYNEHELASVDKEKYGIGNFFEMSVEPKVLSFSENENDGRTYRNYELHRIIGTVLDRDKDKHKVTLLTPEGVVTIKYYAGQFSHYNKQISKPLPNGKKEILEPSWFTRGNKLMITGYRRNNNFYPKTYKNSIYQHSTCLITDIYEDGSLSLVTQRVKI